MSLAAVEGKPIRVLFFGMPAPVLAFGGTSPLRVCLVLLCLTRRRAGRRVSGRVGRCHRAIAVQVQSNLVADRLKCRTFSDYALSGSDERRPRDAFHDALIQRQPVADSR